MWAQLMKMRLKPGKDQELVGLFERMQELEEPGSGLLRSMAMRDQNDPSWVYVLIVFDSEENARARESDPRREEQMKSAREAMMEIFDGPPEFVDMTVLQDVSV